MRSSEETYEAVEIVGEELGAPAGEDLAAERLGRTHVEDEEGKGVGEGVAGAEPGVVQVDDGELEKHRLAAALWERGERRGHGGSGDDDVGVGGEKGVDGGRLDPVEELVGNQLPVQLWQLGVRRDEVGVGGRSGIGRVCRKIHRICRKYHSPHHHLCHHSQVPQTANPPPMPMAQGYQKIHNQDREE